MAIMWPRVLPQWVLQDPRRSAECKVFYALQQALDNSWSVYYSRPWWGLSSTGGEIDGEADFVVAHPDRGLLFIEVKGGLVSHDPTTSKWTSKDRIGVVHGIKDPVQQAMKSKHELHKRFKSASGWPRHRVRLRHGVILPDSDPRGSDSVGGYEQELFCFSTDFRDRCGNWVADRLAPHVEAGRDAEQGPGISAISIIDSIIAAPARLVVPLHRELESDTFQQDSLLTGAQMQAIVFIDAFPRVVVEGGAGTGKTLIACELAARYAKAGKRTLLACLSNALAACLRGRLEGIKSVVILTLPELRVATAGASAEKFDAVLIDEGQDVDWADWSLVESRIGSNGLLRVFFDSNQAVYRARADLETRLGATAVPLRLNLRNTNRIAAVTEPLYRGPLIVCAGSDGRPCVHLEVSSADAPRHVALTVEELISGQGMRAGDVAVLVPDSKAAADIASRLSAARLKATDAVTLAPGAVVVETIAAFKGLECLAIVVLADRICANSNELSYVAVSRARALLVVVGPVSRTKLGDALLAGNCELVSG